MFESIINFFKKFGKAEEKKTKSKDAAKERLHLVLMQDRANVSADFLELMKQEIIEVIKKYIEIEEDAIDVRLTNEVKEDGTQGAPSLYANIPILNIKNEVKKEEKPTEGAKDDSKPENKEDVANGSKPSHKEKEKLEEDKKEETKKEEKPKEDKKETKVEKEDKEDKKDNKGLPKDKEVPKNEKPEQIKKETPKSQNINNASKPGNTKKKKQTKKK